MLDGTTVRGGVGDPEFLRAWLAAAEGPGAGVDPDGARVMTGEQSNTSVVLPGPGSTRPVAILKVLRTIADGPNPDVDVPRRLVEVGWDGVPMPLGWLVGRWTGPDGATAVVMRRGRAKKEIKGLFEVQAVRVTVQGRVLRRGHILPAEEIGHELELLLAAGCVKPVEEPSTL